MLQLGLQLLALFCRQASAFAMSHVLVQVPDEMNRVDKVGIFQQLVELCEVNTDVKNKVCMWLECTHI